MKIKYLLLITIHMFFMSPIFANEDILTQGKIKVTINDLDGFAYKIPDDKRLVFFDSPVRIEKTLFSILNMKHIVKYGKDNNLVDDNKVNTDVAMRIQNLFPIENSAFDIIQENRISLVSKFLKNEESYIQIQENLKKSIKEKELIELAEEKYIVNKNIYIEEETRTIEFILVVYNQNNKKEQYYKAMEILTLIKSKDMTFAEVQKQYKNKQADIETLTLNKFKYDQQNKTLSNKLFSKIDIGLYDKLIDSNHRFSIANITEIKKEKQLSFDDVKEKILGGLRQKSAERNFNTLLMSLTLDKLEVNEKILATLRDRYKQHFQR